MISCYTGSVGSGKTYGAVAEVFEKLSYRGRNHVVANFSVTFSDKQVQRGYRERFYLLSDEQLESPKHLIRLSLRNRWFKRESSALLVIDEAGVYFNSRDWNTRGENRMDWIKFIVNSRKLGYDIVFITQDLRMIDRQMRSVIEFAFKHAKMNNYFWFRWLPFTLFVRSQKWLAGDFKGRVSFRILKPWLAKRYDTMKLFDPAILAEYAELVGEGGTDEGDTGAPRTNRYRLPIRLLAKIFGRKSI